jgi:cytochrome oxidase Cu insertion factor (SCO1/SenC/PrrC family)
MLRKTTLFSLWLLAVMVLSACAPQAATADAMTGQQAAGNPMAQATATGMAMPAAEEMQPSEAMMEQPVSTPTPGEMMNSMETPTASAMDTMMQPTEAMHPMASPTAEAMGGMMSPTESMPGSSMGQSTPTAGMNDMLPGAWLDTTFTNPASGMTFKINDFKGKVILVETFAQWCPTCLAQQKEVVKLHQMLGMNSDLVSVSLDIDPNENADMLKAYLAKNGFDWNFAIAPKAVIREIGQKYGDQFLNPTSAPMLIIDRQGQAHPLSFGIKSAADLQKALDAYLKAGM